jgi:hypothetical protein
MTLTREKLLALKPTVSKIEVIGWGDVFVKPLTELQRSKRVAAMFDENTQKSDDAKLKYRVHMLIDQLCDESGNNLFTEGDSKELLSLEGLKLDSLIEAVTDWNESYAGQKNEQGE